MNGKSLTPQEIKLQQLKEILPEAFAEGKVDWEKLKATLGENINFSNERYVLNWAGKSDAFKVMQTPNTKTLAPAKDESVNFDKTKHIFIEGENLEVLKVLQKSYFGKVKMIYIDPPYNTGNDSFIYPDKFSETKIEYQKRVGDKDEEGYMIKDGMFRKNSKENGQYHSNWLNMMMPRLYLAKNLLRQDGVIFVSIDDNEVHNLRLLMNEIFGEENFVGTFSWRKKDGAGADSKLFFRQQEYILLFSKNVSQLNELFQPLNVKQLQEYSNPDKDLRGNWAPTDLSSPAHDNDPKRIYEVMSPMGKVFEKCWAYTKENFQKLIDDNLIWWGSENNSMPKRKRFLKDKKGLTPRSWIDDILTQDGKKDMKNINFKYFDYPKPVELVKRFLQIGSNPNDFILDFFSGSGTTAHAVMQLNAEDGGNRKCISIQLPELCDEKSEAYKAGYKTVADIAKERIRRAGKKIKEEIVEKIKAKEKEIQKLQNQLDIDKKNGKINKLTTEVESLKTQDLGFKVLKLQKSNFKQWQQIEGNDVKALEKQMELFVDPVSENATNENMIYELLLKSGKDLNSKIEHRNNYYCVNDDELIFMLERATQEIIDSVIKEKPQKVVALDRLFKGNDQLKTNTALQMKDAEIEFKTI